MSRYEPEEPRSARSIAVERAANDVLRGDDVQEPCPECGAILEVTVIRPDVLVRCPNGHIDAHRSIRADPGWGMRMGFLIAAAIIIGLGMVHRFYFKDRPDPHAPIYETNPYYQPEKSDFPAPRPRTP